MTEDELLAEVTALCDRLGLLWHHDPDPHRFGLRRIREWFTRSGSKGFPDLVIAGRRGIIFRELKVDSETSAEQDLWGWALQRGRATTDSRVLTWGIWQPGDLEHGVIKFELEVIAGESR